MPPPTPLFEKVLVLALTVLLVSVSEPLFEMPAPAVPAVLSLTVVPIAVSVPPFQMPPPRMEPASLLTSLLISVSEPAGVKKGRPVPALL